MNIVINKNCREVVKVLALLKRTNTLYVAIDGGRTYHRVVKVRWHKCDGGQFQTVGSTEWYSFTGAVWTFKVE